jgi:hypothetical protein
VVNVEQLKNSVNRMSVDVVREAVLELRLDGLVTEGKTPFNKLHFNTCFAEIEALFQRAGYHKQLECGRLSGVALRLVRPGPLGCRRCVALAQGIHRRRGAENDSGLSILR